MSATPATPWIRGNVTPAVKPSGLTAAFLKNPMLFMRTHSMSPPHDSNRAGDTGIHAGGYKPVVKPPKSSWVSAKPSQKPNPWAAATPTKVKATGAHERSDLEVERLTGAGGIRYVQFVPHVEPNFAGAFSFKFAPEGNAPPDGSWLPIYWLPWEHLKIKSLQIPGVPHGLAEWGDEEYPRFFFTAGINGCSVFAQGNPQSPTLSHAGINGDLGEKHNAGDFWRAQMAKTKSGYGSEKIRGEVNSSDYARSSVSARMAGEAYAKFLNTNLKEFNIEMRSPFGCVFGIRFGRSWTIYLQKSVLYDKVRFHKESEVDTYQHFTQERARLKGGDDTPVAIKTEQVQRKLGPLPLPGSKDVKIYSTTKYISLPLQVMEMYPNKNIVGDLKDVFRVV